MASVEDEIEGIITRLSSLAAAEESPPAMVVVAPDQGESILGNRGGFLHLAVAALKASRGEEQKFKDATWVYANDVDWQIVGLKPDPLAHMYLPEKQTGYQRLRGQIIGYAFLFAVVGVFTAGLIATMGWVDQLYRWVLVRIHS